MADEAQPNPIKIPDEPVEVDDLAVKEGEAFSGGKFAEFAFKWELVLRLVFKIVLFGFVLGINIWWTNNVIRMLWRSGLLKGDFHLNDTVLIALATTSVAAFLALVTVVARHLFPSK